MIILLLSLLLSFCFNLEDILDQTLETVFHRLSKHRSRISKKILHITWYFQSSSWCLDLQVKHCLSCLMYYLKLESDLIRSWFSWRMLDYNRDKVSAWKRASLAQVGISVSTSSPEWGYKRYTPIQRLTESIPHKITYRMVI